MDLIGHLNAFYIISDFQFNKFIWMLHDKVAFHFETILFEVKDGCARIY